MGRPLHPLVPEIILSNVHVGRYHGDFTAVGLFVDISGFSTMTDALMAHGQHGAEVLAEIMRRVLEPIIETIFGQGGFVCASAGDGLTALFPANGSPPDAAVRALAAAQAIQAHAARIQVFDTPYQTFRISAKIGLAPGEAHWGIISQESSSPGSRRSAYFFQGSAVDGCAEAEHQAVAGDIILDDELLDKLGSLVAVEPASSAGASPGRRFCRLLRASGGLPAPKPAHRPEIDLADAAPFFPLSLLSQELSGEFRQVVNMFIALPTVSTEAQLRAFMNSLFRMQEKWGGLVNRLDFGDKGTNLLIFWGAPVAYENDIERALSFILDLQTITSIPINAGITYRISHAGFIGGRFHEEYTCFGRGVNLAARFMTAAPRGEIWVDEPIAERAAGKFEIEYVEERSFKGFSSPQKIFALYERKAEPQPFYRGSLTGRQEELEAVREFITPIFNGQYAGMLAVTGEPGIGKSRLVYEAVHPYEEGLAHRAQIFLGQTDEILRQPFNPFVYWLRRYLGVSETQGEARSKRSFNRRLDELVAVLPNLELAAELDRTRSFLGALVGLRWPDSLYEQLDAEGRYHNTQIALTTLIQAASLQAPVIFILEDIHWLDGDSVALLARLMRALSGPDSPAYPVAILATSREHPGQLASEGSRFARLALPALDPASLRELAGSLLGGPPADALLELVGQRAEGNPFFAEQILSYLRDQGLLVMNTGLWQIEHAKIEGLPVNVSALLVARLDHLSQQVKEAVQMAAVLGREFEVNLLGAMLGSRSVPPEVAAAERAAIWTALDEIRYIFKHALLREAAYQMQVHTRRKALHALAFEAYQRLYADDLSGHYGELAYHAEQAGLPEEARRYLRLAGKAAFDAFQNQQAVEYYTRALALTPDHEFENRFELLVAREEVYGRIGNRAGSERDLAEMEGLLPGLNNPEKEVDLLLARMALALDHSAYSQVEQMATRAAELALANGLITKASRAYRVMGTSFLHQGNYENARIFTHQALEFARRAGSIKYETKALNVIGLIEIDLTRFDDARQAFMAAHDLAQRSNDWAIQAAILNNLGMTSQVQGDNGTAQRYFSQAYEVAQKIGDRLGEGIAIENLGFLAGLTGEYQRARVYHERAIRITREIGSISSEVNGQMNLSACLVALGETETAVSRARLALDLSRKIGERPAEAWALTYLGHSLLARGSLKEAIEAYAEAMTIRDELQQPAMAAEPAAGLARAALRQGKTAEAQQYIEPVLAYLESGGNLDGCDEPLRVYLTCYQVLAQSGDPRAAELLESAHCQLQERAAKITDEEPRASFLNNVAHHKEILLAWETLQSGL